MLYVLLFHFIVFGLTQPGTNLTIFRAVINDTKNYNTEMASNQKTTDYRALYNNNSRITTGRRLSTCMGYLVRVGVDIYSLVGLGR